MVLTRNKLIAAAAASGLIVLGLVALISTISDARVARLEGEVAAAKSRAEILERAARQRELDAAAYKQKTEYLEKGLAEIQAIARRQDEELEIISSDVDSARGGYERAKRVRSIAATADELCAKLAEVGHGCG